MLVCRAGSLPTFWAHYEVLACGVNIVFTMKEAEPTLHAGDRVSAYTIERLVGTGGMGWVFSARHLLTRQQVALKVLRDDQLAIDRSIDRMMGEAAILASIDHPGVPTFYECGVLPDRRPWI